MMVRLAVSTFDDRGSAAIFNRLLIPGPSRSLRVHFLEERSQNRGQSSSIRGDRKAAARLVPGKNLEIDMNEWGGRPLPLERGPHNPDGTWFHRLLEVGCSRGLIERLRTEPARRSLVNYRCRDLATGCWTETAQRRLPGSSARRRGESEFGKFGWVARSGRQQLIELVGSRPPGQLVEKMSEIGADRFSRPVLCGPARSSRFATRATVAADEVASGGRSVGRVIDGNKVCGPWAEAPRHAVSNLICAFEGKGSRVRRVPQRIDRPTTSPSPLET